MEIEWIARYLRDSILLHVDVDIF